jgi:hypothetical protein
MRRLLPALLFAMLLLLPGDIRAQGSRGTTPLEVGASIAACLAENRKYGPSDPGPEIRGNVREALLLENGELFAAILRGVPEPQDMVAPVDPISPPIVVTPLAMNRPEMYRRELLRATGLCLTVVYPPR